MKLAILSILCTSTIFLASQSQAKDIELTEHQAHELLEKLKNASSEERAKNEAIGNAVVADLKKRANGDPGQMLKLFMDGQKNPTQLMAPLNAEQQGRVKAQAAEIERIYGK